MKRLKPWRAVNGRPAAAGPLDGRAGIPAAGPAGDDDVAAAVLAAGNVQLAAGRRLDRRRWIAGLVAGSAAFSWGGLPGARLAFGALPAAAAAGGAAAGGRLVVVLLRGALDGLAAVPVPGDPGWAALRPQAAADDARFGAPLPLAGGPFALHPKLRQLHDWYAAGELLVVHAVASPYRERSHFDAQQVVESGGNRPFEFATGWLGRGLAQAERSGLALGAALPLALRGAAGASSWAPSRGAEVDDGDLLARVARLYEGDAALAAAFAKARAQHPPSLQSAAAAADVPLPGPAASAAADGGAAGFVALARHAGRFLASDADGAPSLAWLETTGWDTHAQQAPRLARGLEVLDQGLAALRQSLGPRWATSTVLVMTEFGRAAALNGSGGTDHGTAGVAFVAGGAVAGGRVLADWPGLAAARLHEGRDLRPTTDLRSVLKPALQRHLGLSTAQIDRVVLPGAPRGLPDLWRS